MNWPQTGALAAFGLSIAALLLLAISPLGWRTGWWHFRFAFSWLMTSSGFLATAALIVSFLVLVLGWSALDQGAMAMAAVAMIVGSILAYLPWRYNRMRTTLPRIHDITTDTEHPPAFAAVLPARATENAASVVYEGPQLAQLQKAAYPDIGPVKKVCSPAEAFEQALDVAKSMPGWSIVASDPAEGRIEASQKSRWFGFTDDIVIRVAKDGSGSRVDMRSISRQGRSDFGVNAARIRAYMTALRQRTD